MEKDALKSFKAQMKRWHPAMYEFFKELTREGVQISLRYGKHSMEINAFDAFHIMQVGFETWSEYDWEHVWKAIRIRKGEVNEVEDIVL